MRYRMLRAKPANLLKIEANPQVTYMPPLTCSVCPVM